jgi:hypothetical protein
VDQAITINPFTLYNVFANYTIKGFQWLRGSKLGITPFTAATATAPYVANPSDQLNLLPGRSIMATLTVGWAPRR